MTQALERALKLAPKLVLKQARLRAGFSLVEMLVALVIFGLISAAAVGVLSVTADNQQVIKARSERTASFQTLRALIKADLTQAAVRPSRDEKGSINVISFRGGEGQLLMAFVRRGIESPEGVARPSLQYVDYRLVDKRLERRVRLALDGAPMGEPQILYNGVSSARIRFLGLDGWIEQFSSFSYLPLPKVVELSLDLEGIGEVRQAFLLPNEGGI
jgi:general secretion pathway protein J